jgi:hypothetical protein
VPDCAIVLRDMKSGAYACAALVIGSVNVVQLHNSGCCTNYLVQICYDLNEFNSGCNERQRLEGEKGIINELVKRKEYRSITTLLIRLGLPRVTINGVGLSNYDRGV